MKNYILISAILELMAGLIFLLIPQWVPDLSESPGSHLAMARMYGSAALGLGIVALGVWRNLENHVLVSLFLSSFLAFNLAAFIAFFASFLAGVFTNPGPAMLHLILGIIAAFYWIRERGKLWPWIKKLLSAFALAAGTFGLLLWLLPTLLHQAGLHPEYAGAQDFDLTDKKALIITTSHGVLNAPGEDSGRKTGVFASEMTIPYYEFLDAGMQVDIASIHGGSIPVDPQSFYYMIKSEADERYLKDEVFQEKVSNSLKIDDIDFTSYDAIWLSGGWGAAYDLGQSEVLGQKISEAYYAQSPIIGSVCHGALGLIQARDTMGNFLITGRSMTGVTDKQLKELGITMTPLHPETELRKRGVNYKYNTGNRDIFQTITVVDQEQRFVTGQNQNSGHETAQKLMSILQEKTAGPLLD